MHRYSDLIERSTAFTLAALTKTQGDALAHLQTGARTSDVKALQMVSLQKAIISIGVFSLVDAMLQDQTNRRSGFAVVTDYLAADNESELLERFTDFKDAINVLKHGHGRSYERLLKRSSRVPFIVKQPDQRFFNEGDVSEIAGLVRVDDDFVLGIARVAQDILAYIERRERHIAGNPRAIAPHRTEGVDRT